MELSSAWISTTSIEVYHKMQLYIQFSFAQFSLKKNKPDLVHKFVGMAVEAVEEHLKA